MNWGAKLKIIQVTLLEKFRSQIDFDPLICIDKKSKEATPFDYFKFYNSVSSVYSSKIEGEEVDVDSYLKHKFLNVRYEPDYTKRADDLFLAYEFMEVNDLNEENILKAHEILSKHFLAESQRGVIRSNPMFVMNEKDRIEYVACNPSNVKSELQKLIRDIEYLLNENLDIIDTFYFAAYIHLVFLKIHPMSDGNGRTARLIEKWFLRKKIGPSSAAIKLEKNYFINKAKYYSNIRILGLEYPGLNYNNALGFLLMTIKSLPIDEE